jgi:hypothetical protein
MRLLLLALIAMTLGTLVLVSCGVGRSESVPAGSSTPEAGTQTPNPVSTTPSPTSTSTPTPESDAPIEEEINPPRGPFVGNLNTNYSKHSVPLDEIVSGGPPPDGIPPIDSPRFETVDEFMGMEPLEPVISLEINGEARAYPLEILIWHEIVNDELAGVPVSVTFCPLCNTAIVFDRRLDGTVYDFGTSGMLRHSDLVMYDRQTHSLWQQLTGEAIVGDLTGKKLAFIPAAIVSWQEFQQAHPDGLVLSRDTGYDRMYGVNPYAGYDRVDQPPFLFFGKLDERLLPMERVLALSEGDEAVAFPFSALAQTPVAYYTLAGKEVVVLYEPETVSALDKTFIPQSRQVGSAAAFSPVVDGKRLSLAAVGGGFRDQETGTTWDISGQAVDGPLKGKSLEPEVSFTSFWFAWAVFQVDTAVYQP